MHTLYVATLLSLVSVSSFSQDRTFKSRDLADLNNLEVKWSRFWNMHNMDSMGTLLREDVDFVNVAGQWLKGKKKPWRCIKNDT